MVLARFQFLGRAHHALALDAANGARLLVERELKPRNIGAERRIDRRHARPRVRRAADDLLHAVNGFHLAHAQLVGVRMRHGFNHLAHGERRKLRRRVDNFLDLEPRLQHQRQNLVEPGLGGQVIGQPGKGELHQLSPPLTDGVVHGAKP